MSLFILELRERLVALQLHTRYMINAGGCGAIAIFLHDLLRDELKLKTKFMVYHVPTDVKIWYRHVFLKAYDEQGQEYYIDGVGEPRSKYTSECIELTAFQVRQLRSIQNNHTRWNFMFDRDNLPLIYEEIHHVCCTDHTDGLQRAKLLSQWARAGTMDGRTHFCSLLHCLRATTD